MSRTMTRRDSFDVRRLFQAIRREVENRGSTRTTGHVARRSAAELCDLAEEAGFAVAANDDGSLSFTNLAWS